MPSSATSRAPGLVVADPGLRTLTGHNAGALLALGALAGVTFFGHQDLDAELASLARSRGVRLRPFFRQGLYEAYRQDWTLGEAHGYISALAADYLRLLAEVEASDPQAVVLHHTMDWPHLHALGAALHARGNARSVRQAVFLMFNPGIRRSGEPVEARRYLSYRIALSRLQRARGVRLFAAHGELAAGLPAAFALQGEPAIHPCFFFAAHEQPSPGEPARRGPVLLYLGDAKEEKGFCRVAELARLALRHAPPQARLVAQYQLHAPLASPAVRRAAAEIEQLAREDARLEVMRGFVPQDPLQRLLDEAAWAAFQYDPVAYADKSSGLLWQACSAGTPLVVIGESWLSREARRLNPRVRVFPALQDLERELARRGALRFDPHPIDARYRAIVFRPLADFVAAELAA